jgi:predicted GIY-YIG superfamily endonuclease
MITAIRVSEETQINNVSYPDLYPLSSESTELSDTEKDRLSQWLEDSCGDFRDRYAVYVLDCTLPPEGERSLSQQYRIQQAYDLIESQSRDLSHKDHEIKDAAEAERVYYVGQTNDVLDRIDRHLAGTGKGGGSWFTHALDPNHLEEVHWYSTEAESCDGEEEVADEIGQRDESNHVYWD